MNEIVVGSTRLRLPSGWTWKAEGSLWCAINPFGDVIVRADVHGDEGVHVCAWTTPTSNMYVPMVVFAMVVIANSGGSMNDAFESILQYVSPAGDN